MDNVDREHLCPVCGFDLGFRPWDGPNPSDEICPCCGIQFGYHDAAGDDEKGAGRFTPSGVRIGSRPVCPGEGAARPAPHGWNPGEQVERVNSGG